MLVPSAAGIHLGIKSCFNAIRESSRFSRIILSATARLGVERQDSADARDSLPQDRR